MKSCFKDGTGALLRFQQISLCNRTQQAAVRSFQFAFYIFFLAGSIIAEFVSRSEGC